MPTHSSDFLVLDKVIRISNSTVDIEKRLNNLLKLLVREFSADRALLFTLDMEGKALTLRSTDVEEQAALDPVLFDLTDSFIGRSAFTREAIILGPDDADKGHWPGHELFSGFETLGAFPIMDDQYLYGVLALLNQEPRKYRKPRLDLIETISREMAGTIRNSRLYIEAKKRIAELSVLFEVSRTTSSTMELDKILDYVVNVSARVIMAEGCALNVLDETTGTLRVASEFGTIPNGCRFKQQLGRPETPLKSEIIKCVSRDKPYVGPANQDPYCTCMRREGGENSVLCLPLSFKSLFKGTLSLYNKITSSPNQRQEFNQEDLHLMTTMGTMISSALENALTFQTVELLGLHNQALVSSLSSLYQISSGMMTTIKTDELLSIIINALTHPDGLGFDRALIFLMDDDEKNLVGAALSPLTVLEKKPGTMGLTDTLNMGLAMTGPDIIRTEAFRKIQIPVRENSGVLAKTVLTKTAEIINEPELGLDKEVLLDFGTHPFAVLPMMAKGTVVGVFTVDRAFSGAGITSEDMRNLSMLANQTGLAIENSRLYEYIETVNRELSQARERLLESEKLAALGEMAAGMAHEIRNPLVSIGGFTRRILKKIEPDSPIKRYIEVIIEEVTRLEKTLHDILTFSRESDDHYERYKLNKVLDESLYLLRRDLTHDEITVVKQYGDLLPEVFIDERQIKHVFYNLFLNALQAMGKGGTLTIRTYMSHGPEMPQVSCEVTDTGPGVPAHVMDNIFNPFFTTRAAGVGLGLSIVHKILTRHHGEINVVNRPGQGASFIVNLPTARESGLYLK